MKDKFAEILKKTSIVDYFKLAGMLIGIGMVLGRQEYVMQKNYMQLESIVKVHMTEDKYEKREINGKYDDLKRMVNDNTRVITNLSVFLRPDEVRVHRRR